MDLHSEEDVKFKFLTPYLVERSFAADHITYNVSIQVKEGRKKKTIFADAIACADAEGSVPLVCIETKGPDEVLTEGDRDQGISYARLQTPIIPVVLLTNGTIVKVYDTFTKKEIKGGLAKKNDLVKKLRKSTLSDEQRGALFSEAQHEIFKVDDVQEFKRILRASHNAIRNNEGYDPTKAFDELSKVMFCKLYEEKRDQSRFRADIFDDQLKRIGSNVVQQIFEETKKDAKFKSLFQREDTIELGDRTVRELVRQFENYDLSLTEFDVKGEAFEHFLGDTFTGGLGQYFTPRNVVHFIIDALAVKVGEKIIDPFSGTGGFLIYAYQVVAKLIEGMGLSEAKKKEYLQALGEECMFGTDWNERTSQACRMNMTVHGEGDAGKHIFKQSGFVNLAGEIEPGQFDVVATNPPFGSSETDPAILQAMTLGNGRRSLERAALALERALDLVKPGGRVGLVIMDGILSNSSMQFIRDHVLQRAHVHGLISLAPETFEAYGGRSDTTIVLMERRMEDDEKGAQGDTFMAVCRNAGYAPNGAEIAGNELPAILEAYQLWQAGKPFSLPNAWVGKIDKRLDPKHYWRPEFTANAAPQDQIETVAAIVATMTTTVGDIGTRIEALTREIPTKEMVLGDLLREVVDKHKLISNEEYALVGVRWWGGGAFVRETKPGSEVKSATSLNAITPGVLMYNRLFAYRGSFAVAGDECKGAYASNEFPTFVTKDGVEDPELLLRYLVHVLNSPRMLDLVDAHSSGSTKTSRNRLNQKVFLKFAVPVPVDPDDMRELVDLLDLGDEFRAAQETASEASKRLREALAELLPRA